MTSQVYTLEIPREVQAVSRHNHPSSALISAVIYALTVSITDSLPALVIASILPVGFMLSTRFPLSRLYGVNMACAVMVLTIALTWPDLSDGLRMGMIISLRVNMICIVFGATIYPLGTAGMYEALCALKVPEKLRVLVILTLRGIYILRERYETAIISVRLRAPNLRGLMRLKVFACMMGMILLQSVVSSENMIRAVKCRGGFGGFMQSGKRSLNVWDWVYIAVIAVYSAMIAAVNYA